MAGNERWIVWGVRVTKEGADWRARSRSQGRHVGLNDCYCGKERLGGGCR